MNKIKHWIKADEVVEEGLYILSYGDVLSESSRFVNVVRDEDGDLIGEECLVVSLYDDGYKFALMEP